VSPRIEKGKASKPAKRAAAVGTHASGVLALLPSIKHAGGVRTNSIKKSVGIGSVAALQCSPE